jgi:hypothetical protein
MNKQVIDFHLREALDEMQKILQDMNSSEFSFEAFQVQMSHAYQHLNSAWNSRDCSMEEFARCDQAQFDSWRKMPSGEELLLL